jgi:hypothetical protein
MSHFTPPSQSLFIFEPTEAGTGLQLHKRLGIPQMFGLCLAPVAVAGGSGIPGLDYPVAFGPDCRPIPVAPRAHFLSAQTAAKELSAELIGRCLCKDGPKPGLAAAELRTRLRSIAALPRPSVPLLYTRKVRAAINKILHVERASKAKAA